MNTVPGYPTSVNFGARALSALAPTANATPLLRAKASPLAGSSLPSTPTKTTPPPGGLVLAGHPGHHGQLGVTRRGTTTRRT